MVEAVASLPLPWLAPLLLRTLRQQRAHALLLHGPQGVGQFELALALAQAWLCESAAPGDAACGHCGSCRLVQARSHPDLLVLIPEALQLELGWVSEGDDSASERAGKTKPSKEIKVDAIRAAVQFAQTTSARGRGKVVVLHPAERMNGVAANTLLKTLEEPVGPTRFVLASAAADALLPTIRSRCQAVALGLPPTALAVAWLAEQGVAHPEVLLAAAGGQPQEALAWASEGIDAALWTRLPSLVAQGQWQTLATWPLPRVLDALQKICHDALCAAHGAMPRYFPAQAIATNGDSEALSAWRAELQRVARHAEHPWSAALVVESLVGQGRRALAGRAKPGPATGSVSVHSRA